MVMMLFDSMIFQYRLGGAHEPARLSRRRNMRRDGTFHPSNLIQAREAHTACIVRRQVHDRRPHLQTMAQLIHFRRASMLGVA